MKKQTEKKAETEGVTRKIAAWKGGGEEPWIQYVWKHMCWLVVLKAVPDFSILTWLKCFSFADDEAAEPGNSLSVHVFFTDGLMLKMSF